MHFRSETICFGLALAITLLAGHSARAEDRAPCQKIKQACEQAGFKQGDVTEGLGLQIDCIQPIIAGTPQRQSAAKPLPTVDAALIAACKARNPQFGKPKPNNQSGPATSGSDF
jgi:hypothetical protein